MPLPVNPDIFPLLVEWSQLRGAGVCVGGRVRLGLRFGLLTAEDIFGFTRDSHAIVNGPWERQL